jgi:hypothetical protein
MRFSRVALVLLVAGVAAGQLKPVPKAGASVERGSVVNGTYHNSFFGFSYKVPFGWVDRTSSMQEGSEAGKSMTLLAVFERPPEARGETVNSAVVIAAESVASYPGMKEAAQYFGPLTELTAAKGFKVENEPYDVRAGGRELVRGDFSKEKGTVGLYQSTLVMLHRGYAVSFTFIGGNKDDVDEIVEGLSFGVGKKR